MRSRPRTAGSPADGPTQRRGPQDNAVLGVIRVGALMTAAALALVAVVFALANATTDGLVVQMPGTGDIQQVGYGDTIVPTVLGGVVGALLAWATGRFVARPRVTFLAVCIGGLILYGIVPFTAAEEVSTGVWLNAMHVAAALPIVGGHARRLPAARPEARS